MSTPENKTKVFCPNETMREIQKNQTAVKNETFRRNLDLVKKLLAEAIEAADLQNSRLTIESDMSGQLSLYARDSRDQLRETVQIYFQNPRGFD